MACVCCVVVFAVEIVLMYIAVEDLPLFDDRWTLCTLD